ncbi:MAG: type II TA system antitoxin MqsA family protein [Eggerthellaceae bacterium]
MRCDKCGGRMAESLDPIEVDFKGEHLTVLDVPHFLCENCDDIAFNAEQLDAYSHAIDEAYRERMGLLSPSQIKSIRKSISCTQAQFESLVGVSTPTVSRWETGASIQQKTADNLMRVIEKFPGIADFLAERAEAYAPANRGARTSRNR